LTHFKVYEYDWKNDEFKGVKAKFSVNKLRVDLYFDGSRKNNEFWYIWRGMQFKELMRNFESKSQVEFDIEVAAGASPKAIALKAAINLKATWVILDRSRKHQTIMWIASLVML
jgi:endo-1,4-beta-D-glucanase Y